MRRFIAVLAAALLLPAVAHAQEVTTDTVTVEAMGSTVDLIVSHAPADRTDGKFIVGDTIDFAVTGVDEFGDTIAVQADFVSLDTTVVEIIEQGGATARGLVVGKGTAPITVVDWAIGDVVAMETAYLDDGAWVWVTDPVEMEVGDTVQLCAWVEYEDGQVGVGTHPDCATAYNAMVVNQVWRRTNLYAFATRGVRIPGA